MMNLRDVHVLIQIELNGFHNHELAHLCNIGLIFQFTSNQVEVLLMD
jgi:hypothetical protein